MRATAGINNNNKNTMNKTHSKKIGATVAIALPVILASSASAAIDPTGFTGEVTSAVAGVETVLTAGLAIVGAFFAWGVLKKALGKAA